MNRFIFDILKFLLPFIIFSIITLSYYIFKRAKVQEEMKIISEYECLIMGDSQMQRILPENFSFRTYNFASSAEHYYFTYQKITNLIDQDNFKIDKIILGVDLHSFAPVFSRRFDTRFPAGRANLFRYLYFLYDDSRAFLNMSDIFSLNLIKGVYKGPDWGGSGSSHKENPEAEIIYSTYQEVFSVVDRENPYPFEQMSYLQKIDSLCYSHHIDLYLVSLPYHPIFLSLIDANYHIILSQAINKMQNAKYINFLSFDVTPDLMSDGTHLNKKGSDIITKMINDMISSRELIP